MDLFDTEILSFWDQLAKEDVRYIMLGGFATNFHGYSRATDDMDLWAANRLQDQLDVQKLEEIRKISTGEK